jgi:hypothetical protein
MNFFSFERFSKPKEEKDNAQQKKAEERGGFIMLAAARIAHHART